MPDGVVRDLWRFPVHAMGGEQLRSTQIDTRGVAGDRQHYACGPEGRLTAHDVPGLAGWTATFPFNPDGAVAPEKPPPFPVLVAPGGLNAWRWGDPRLVHALTRDLGRTIELVREIGPVHRVIVSFSEPEQDPAAAGINVYLALALAQGGWAGRELAFRDGVRLRLVASRADGPGIEARLVTAGRVTVGEPVTLAEH